MMDELGRTASEASISDDDAISDMGEEGIPGSPEEWVTWVRDRISETDRAYTIKPDFMLGHFRGELSTAKDYAGREILELVQNAADAAAEVGGQGKVRIEVNKHGLCVANTGQPFRPGGVRSLMTSHTSDKPGRQATLIGAKGLGFRALLNWSSEPFITSGALEIGFSRSFAEKHVEELAVESGTIRKLLGRSDQKPVPVLAFPAVGSAVEDIGGPAERELIARARALRGLGYQTVVVAAFSSPKAQSRALSQLKEFEPNFLLFVESLDEITLAAEGEQEIRWTKKPSSDGRYIIEIHSGEVVAQQHWSCHRRKGTILSGQSPKNYELAIGLRTDAANAPGKLHSYFPTDIPLPFPALFHATLELDSHRKTLNADSDVNSDVLSALSVFYADFLQLLVESGVALNPIAFLTRATYFPGPLQSFEEATYRAAAQRPLIPTMRGTRVPAIDTQLGPKGYGLYLPKRLFGSLADCRNDADRGTLERLRVAELDPVQALATLRQAQLTIAERAAAVVGIATHLPGSYHDRSLLLDSNERPLTRNNSCFPLPASGKPPRLPRWARAKFLHPELWAKINAGLEGQPRDRFRKLADFGVHEFNSEGVITSLRRQAADVIKRGKADLNRVRRELIEALFNLRQTVAREVAFPPGRIEVACRDGQWRDTLSVHLSENYGVNGSITAELYATQPARLLAKPEDNGLTRDMEGLADFFRWIGVQEWPAASAAALPRSLQSRLIAALPPTVEVFDDNHRQVIDRSELRWGANCKAEYLSIMGLDKILASASSTAILAWLARDPRFDVVNGMSFWTKLSAKSGRAMFRDYGGKLPDFVRESLSRTPWLDTSDGRRVAPCDAMIAPGRLADLFAAPRPPRSDEEAKFGLDRAHWLRGLSHAGVPTNLSDLSEERLLRLLGSLHAQKPSAELVRRLYLQVLELDTFDASKAVDAANCYQKNGMVQVRKGGSIEWVRPSEALYLDRDNFPAAARAYFSLIDLPPRRSAADVLTRFGVAPVSKQNFSLTVSRVVEDEGAISARLRGRLKEALPFIKVYRAAHSAETQRLRRLDQLELKISVEVQLEFSLGSNVFQGTLEPGKYVLDRDILIVAVNVAEAEDELMLRAITAISDGLAELFELQAGDDFEKLLAAETNSLRTLQLRRLLNNQTDEEVDRLLATIEDEVTTDPGEAFAMDAGTLARGEGPGHGSLSNDKTTSHHASKAPPPPASPPPAAIPQKQLTGVAVTKLDTPEGTARGGGTVGLRIAAGGGGGSPGRTADSSAPTDAEQWAILFEQREGRFPLQVSRLQGRDAYGCDCLSFATEQDLIAFKSDPKKLSLVERFIEVKSGTVRLTPNEVRSAERHKRKYFIYRIQFDAGSRMVAHLTVVAHPLSYKSALARECEVRVDDIPARQRFRLNPMLK
ncbi:DUF3883 domain-containing protein [Ensifer aridi]|uniref:DUF3883 domain-containing protein n=1 Tax=Ensifer aridi TaxID=1708715 RepID=UPI00358E3BE2